MAFWAKKSEGSSPTTGESRASGAAVASISAAAVIAPEVKSPAGAAPNAVSASPAVLAAAISGEPTTPRSSVRTAISVGTKIQGKLNFDTPVQIDGFVSGEIFSSKHLSIGASAQIEAAIVAPSVSVAGRVNGQITVSERLDIRRGAVVSGTVTTPVLVLEEGGVLNAKISMGLEAAVTENLAQRIEKSSVSEKTERAAALAPHTSVSLDAKVPSSSQMH